MSDKIWSTYELQKRDEQAACIAEMISSSEHPKTMAEIHMPVLLEYEILPNIIWDGMSDDEIREFAQNNISPPRQLSRPPNFCYYNKFPLLPLKTAFMLCVDVEPGTPIRTQAEKDHLTEIVLLAQSFATAGKKPFHKWRTGKFGDYQIEPDKIKEWADLNGYPPPDEWKPELASTVIDARLIEVEGKEGSKKDDLRRMELLEAAIFMKESRDHKTPKNQDEVAMFVELNIDEYSNCKIFKEEECHDSSNFVSSLIRSVGRAGGSVRLDPAYKSANNNIR